jgi:omega-hydroxy-beta-dihydromenaquinone-9 sulfotransferase
MSFSYLLIGVRFGKFLSLLKRNRISYYPKYLGRIIFLFYNSIWSSFFYYLEKAKYGKKINQTPLGPNPIIIIGHWRTGTTLLHKLLSLDGQFVTPSLFEAAYPDSFLISRKYLKPVMSPFVERKRPVDNMMIGFDEPQEDEYALIKIAWGSPLEKLLFPSNKDYFLKTAADINNETTIEKNWEKEFTWFCKKLVSKENKRLVLKNPFHSLRIKALIELFPDAKFIYLNRHPYAVIPSTIKLWTIVGQQNALNKNFTPPKLNEVIEFFYDMNNKISTDLASIPEKNYINVRFEDFEADILNELKNIYKFFSLEFTDQLEQDVISYLESVANYQKNAFNLSQEEKNLINTKLQGYMSKYGYKAN